MRIEIEELSWGNFKASVDGKEFPRDMRLDRFDLLLEVLAENGIEVVQKTHHWTQGIVEVDGKPKFQGIKKEYMTTNMRKK